MPEFALRTAMGDIVFVCLPVRWIGSECLGLFAGVEICSETSRLPSAWLGQFEIHFHSDFTEKLPIFGGNGWAKALAQEIAPSRYSPQAGLSSRDQRRIL
jgi:hypothetical protein